MKASTFEAVLGIRSSKTPITQILYKKYGCPFLQSYKEVVGINGPAPIQSMRGKKRKAEDGDLFREVEPNTVDEKKPFLPVSEMELVLANVKLEQDI
ncbi:hypothetical protein IFR05_009134 [Cadophora sp. M221]|nr:hypothetical protein IFR05_009134 [Cadophora sp. M221]